MTISVRQKYSIVTHIKTPIYPELAKNKEFIGRLPFNNEINHSFLTALAISLLIYKADYV
jgi:hypothetical protein